MRIRGCRLPVALYADRRNSIGLDLGNPDALEAVRAGIARGALAREHVAGPLIDGVVLPGAAPHAVTNPADRRDTVGQLARCDRPRRSPRHSMRRRAAQPAWDARGGVRARGVPGSGGGAAREVARRFLRAAGARSGQDLARRDRRGARGGGFLPLLRGARARGIRPRQAARGSHRRASTSCRCTAAACSPASARGIFRWRFSPAR